jgi:hypothetical protein
LKRKDSTALECNKFLPRHLKTAPGLFFALVLQAPNL